MPDADKEKLLLLTAGLFAVRLFRAPAGTRPDDNRDFEAHRAALDAKAIIKAVDDIDAPAAKP